MKRSRPGEIPHFSRYRIDSVPVIYTKHSKPELKTKRNRKCLISVEAMALKPAGLYGLTCPKNGVVGVSIFYQTPG